jgi:hypothetical protein
LTAYLGEAVASVLVDADFLACLWCFLVCFAGVAASALGASAAGAAVAAAGVAGVAALSAANDAMAKLEIMAATAIFLSM